MRRNFFCCTHIFKLDRHDIKGHGSKDVFVVDSEVRDRQNAGGRYRSEGHVLFALSSDFRGHE
jgi:hypothetical protein